ncbi:hypothetical protein C8Q73DRAFT_795687 [Cubamyces lactineus]|nr:hypothetical protein C8Q73DRAFT_795687 [Cubamyces lactineus]
MATIPAGITELDGTEGQDIMHSADMGNGVLNGEHIAWVIDQLITRITLLEEELRQSAQREGRLQEYLSSSTTALNDAGGLKEGIQQADRALSLIPQVLVLIANAGPHAAPLAFYLDHIANWPRASECWNFESERYFGTDGRQIQKSRLLTLAPRNVVLAPET